MTNPIVWVARESPRVSTRHRPTFFFRKLWVVALSLHLLALVAHLLLRLTIGDSVKLLALANLLTPYYFLPLVLVLPLAILLRLRRLAMLGGILAFIGLAAYAPRFIARTQTGDESALNLVTWNAFRRNTETTEIAQWVRQQTADLVLMQELPFAARETVLANIHSLYPYTYVGESSDGVTVTLSRLPILESESSSLMADGRVQQRLVIDHQGQQVVIYNLHLSNPIPPRPMLWFRNQAPFLLHLIDSYDDEQRDVEIEMLLDQIAAEQHPLIVAGDFNLSDQSAQYSRVAAHLRDSFAEAGFGLGGTWPATDTRGLPAFIPPLLRLDYVWHSADWTSLNAAVVPAPGSDHLSVSAALALSQ